MLNMQRTHGNRPVQRHLSTHTPAPVVAVQREKDSWWQKAYDQVGFYSDQVGQAGSLLQGADDIGSWVAAGEGMSHLGSFNTFTNVLGAGTGLLGAVAGTAQMLDPESSVGERIEGGLGAASGGIGFLGGFESLGLGAGGASGLAAPLTGSAGAFTSGAGAAIGSGGAVLGAGLAGWGLGSAISENTRVGGHAVDHWGSLDKLVTRGAQGLGIMEDGEDKSALLSASDWASDNPWKAAGIGLATSPISVPLAAATALGVGSTSLITGAASAAADYGGRALDWAGDLF
jgi:hypothetical protein